MAARVTRLMRHDRRRIEGLDALVGVDEAGRGALCGPVTAGAVLLLPAFFGGEWFRRRAPRVDDSKQLSPADRAGLHDDILALAESGVVRAAVASASVQEIEERNILGATQLAMGRALQAVFLAAGVDTEGEHGLFGRGEGAPRTGGIPIERCAVLIDGKPLRSVGYAHEALVKGDTRSLAVAMASILAKVTRDRLLDELDGRFPGYGFAEHKGYATEAHRAAILSLGPCTEHRALFLRKLLASRSTDHPGQTEFDFGDGLAGEDPEAGDEASGI